MHRSRWRAPSPRDIEFNGCPMKKGDKLLLNFPAANRDPSVFDHADEVRLDRQENRHVAFGSGIHRCAGSNLARMELRVALEEWLTASSRLPPGRRRRRPVGGRSGQRAAQAGRRVRLTGRSVEGATSSRPSGDIGSRWADRTAPRSVSGEQRDRLRQSAPRSSSCSAGAFAKSERCGVASTNASQARTISGSPSRSWASRYSRASPTVLALTTPKPRQESASLHTKRGPTRTRRPSRR